MSMLIPLAICCFISASAILAISKWLQRSQRSSLPPGPRGLPFIGTPSELTRDYLWLDVAKYKNLYGPISAVTAFGKTIILLNDVEVARKLLEKQASIYSERPPMVFGHMYVQHTAFVTHIQSKGHFRCTSDNLTSTLNSGPALKAQRTAAQHYFGSADAILRLRPITETEIHRFLARILENPQDLESHVKTYI